MSRRIKFRDLWSATEIIPRECRIHHPAHESLNRTRLRTGQRTLRGIRRRYRGGNRIAAWVIGTRNAIKALLLALLESIAALREAEANGDLTARRALLEESKSLPFGSAWDEYCRREKTPIGSEWLTELRGYETEVLSKRAL